MVFISKRFVSLRKPIIGLSFYYGLLFRSDISWMVFKEMLVNQTWTPEKATEWQEFFNTANRLLIYGASPNLHFETLPGLPNYEDLKPVPCVKGQTTPESTSSTVPPTTKPSNSAMHHSILTIFPLISVIIAHMFI